MGVLTTNHPGLEPCALPDDQTRWAMIKRGEEDVSRLLPSNLLTHLPPSQMRKVDSLVRAGGLKHNYPRPSLSWMIYQIHSNATALWNSPRGRFFSRGSCRLQTGPWSCIASSGGPGQRKIRSRLVSWTLLPACDGQENPSWVEGVTKTTESSSGLERNCAQGGQKIWSIASPYMWTLLSEGQLWDTHCHWIPVKCARGSC